MNTRIVQPTSGYEFGPTTWRCKCGASTVVDPSPPADRSEGRYFSIGSLPLGWVEMSVEVGTADGLNKRQKEILCQQCAYERGLGPKPAGPAPTVYMKKPDGRVFIAMRPPAESTTKRLK